MEKKPKVTVIIPTHNHAHFLPECLSCVKNQTYKDYEVIVVNNGSTDKTEQEVKRLSWDKVRYHYQEDTGSVAGPRNTGIRLARGEYVAFLDSDDIWYEDKLEKVLNILDKKPDIDIVSHDLYMVREGKEKKLLKSGPLKEDMFLSLLNKNCLFGSATVAKRELMEKMGGFDPCKEFVHVEDYETWLRIAKLGKKFYFINEPLGEYRAHSLNLSFDFESALCHEKNVIHKHFAQINNMNRFLRKLFYNKRLSVIYYKIAMQFLFRKQLKKSLYNFWRSFCLNPFSLFTNLKYTFETKQKNKRFSNEKK